MSSATQVRVHDLLGGTLPLLRAKAGTFWKVPLVFGFVPGLLGAWFLRLRVQQYGLLEDLGLIYFIALLLVAFASPIVAAENMVFTIGSVGVGGGRRQQDLLAQPIGRLALPFAHLGAAVVVFCAWLGALVLGLAAVVDVSVIVVAHAAAADKLVWVESFWAPAAFALAFTLASGGGTFVAALTWAITGFVVWAMLGAIGHRGGAVNAAGAILLAAYTVAYLVIPFVLHSRGAAHWSVRRGGGIGREGREVAILMTVAAAVVVYAALKFCVLLVGVLVLGGLVILWIQVRIPRTPRRLAPSSRLAFGVLLAMTMPLAVLGAVLDSRAVASVTPEGEVQLQDWRVSPDGKRVAFEIVPRGQPLNHWGGGIHRVAVLDLDGGQPILLPGRFVRILGWSEDGRYVAAADMTLGRLSKWGPPWWGVPTRLLQQRSALAAALEPFSLYRTTVVDTATGAVEELAEPWIVKPGWRNPADLVRYRVDTGAGVDLFDRDGRTVHVDAQLGETLRFLRYDQGEPIFELMRYEPNVVVPEERPYHDSQVLRWSRAGLVPDDSLQRLSFRRVPVPPAGPAGMPANMTLDVGAGKQLELAGVLSYCTDTWRDDSILISDAEGLQRVSLPDGELQLLRASTEPTWFHAGQMAPPGHVLVARNQEFSLLDTEAWTFTPVQQPESGASFLSIAGDRILTVEWQTGTIHAQDPDGARTQILPWKR